MTLGQGAELRVCLLKVIWPCCGIQHEVYSGDLVHQVGPHSLCIPLPYPPSWDTYLGKRPHSQQWSCLWLWMVAVWIRSVWGLALARSTRGARSEPVCRNRSQKIVDERKVPVCWKRAAQRRGRERGGVGRIPANMFAEAWFEWARALEKEFFSHLPFALCSFFLAKSGRRLSFVPKAIVNILLNLWIGQLSAVS